MFSRARNHALAGLTREFQVLVINQRINTGNGHFFDKTVNNALAHAVTALAALCVKTRVLSPVMALVPLGEPWVLLHFVSVVPLSGPIDDQCGKTLKTLNLIDNYGQEFMEFHGIS